MKYFYLLLFFITFQNCTESIIQAQHLEKPPNIEIAKFFEIEIQKLKTSWKGYLYLNNEKIEDWNIVFQALESLKKYDIQKSDSFVATALQCEELAKSEWINQTETGPVNSIIKIEFNYKGQVNNFKFTNLTINLKNENKIVLKTNQTNLQTLQIEKDEYQFTYVDAPVGIQKALITFEKAKKECLN